ncbi:FAD-dependent oxidoreductase, partial [Candidatus Curtissbacteria bacterium]|nr:FAD-dependent oxidoreductase [Candidatus Curtissbacteria bacterium]
MKKFDYLIIGGSAAGTTAADVIRGMKPEETIAIVTDENHEQYSRVLLPHYLRRKISREQVFLKKPEWYIEKGINLIKGVRAENLDSNHKVVKLNNGEEIEYRKILIAIGGKVVPFGAIGEELNNIFYLRTIEDADSVLEAGSKSKNAVVIGGGFIGLEFAHSFKIEGVANVTVLVKEPFFWDGKLDEDSAKVLTDVLERNGVKILTGEEVDRFEGQGKVSKVVTKSGKQIDADVVGIGIGIKSDLAFLKYSGINIGRAILTNEYLETNLMDVYAAGDCAEFHDVVFDRQHIMGNWANATSQGSVVGKTM